jgi:hypothetical protein
MLVWLFLGFLTYIGYGTQSHEEIKAVEQECKSSNPLEYDMEFFMIGFTDEELNNATIKHIKNGKVENVYPLERDIERMSYLIFKHPLYVMDVYEIEIGKNKYLLSNLTKDLTIEGDQRRKCVLDRCKIDGKDACFIDGIEIHKL